MVKKSAKKPVSKLSPNQQKTFMERWDEKSDFDKKWNLLQVAWMLGGIVIACALLINYYAVAMTLVGCIMIYFAFKYIGKMKAEMKNTAKG